MSLSFFADKTNAPSEGDVAAALGRTNTLWMKVQRDVAGRLPDITTVWGYTSKSTGWGLRVKQGDRVIVYLTPCHRHFLASFALGQRAVEAAHRQKLSPALLAAIDNAPKYAEGRGVRFAVRVAADAKSVVELAMIKAAT
jgi:hypothetical protein